MAVVYCFMWSGNDKEISCWLPSDNNSSSVIIWICWWDEFHHLIVDTSWICVGREKKVMNENRFYKIVTNGVNGWFLLFICLFCFFAAFNGTVSNWALAKAICPERFLGVFCLAFSGNSDCVFSVDIMLFLWQLCDGFWRRNRSGWSNIKSSSFVIRYSWAMLSPKQIFRGASFLG